MDKDYFLSYSNNIYKEFVYPLYKSLFNENIRVWIDKTEIILGQEIYDNLTNVLDEIKNKFGVIFIFDETFFKKEWCLKELRYSINNNIELYPILYKIKKIDLPEEFQSLKKLNMVTIKSHDDLKYIVKKIKILHLCRINFIILPKIKIDSDLGKKLLDKVIINKYNIIDYIFNSDNIGQYLYHIIIKNKKENYFNYLLFCINQINDIKKKILKNEILDEYDYIIIDKSVKILINCCYISH